MTGCYPVRAAIGGHLGAERKPQKAEGPAQFGRPHPELRFRAPAAPPTSARYGQSPSVAVKSILPFAGS